MATFAVEKLRISWKTLIISEKNRICLSNPIQFDSNQNDSATHRWHRWMELTPVDAIHSVDSIESIDSIEQMFVFSLFLILDCFCFWFAFICWLACVQITLFCLCFAFALFLGFVNGVKQNNRRNRSKINLASKWPHLPSKSSEFLGKHL